MTDSILNTVKAYVGLTPDYDAFDTVLITEINSVFMMLNQMGIGPSDMFSITDDTKTWSEFIGDDQALEPVKTYMSMKVRMMFDPPTTSSVTEAINNTIKELEWRLFTNSELDRISS